MGAGALMGGSGGTWRDWKQRLKQGKAAAGAGCGVSMTRISYI